MSQNAPGQIRGGSCVRVGDERLVRMMMMRLVIVVVRLVFVSHL